MNRKQDKYLTNHMNIIMWIGVLIIACFVGSLYVLSSSVPNSIIIIFGIGGLGLFICLIFIMNEYESLGDKEEDI